MTRATINRYKCNYTNCYHVLSHSCRPMLSLCVFISSQIIDRRSTAKLFTFRLRINPALIKMCSSDFQCLHSFPCRLNGKSLHKHGVFVVWRALSKQFTSLIHFEWMKCERVSYSHIPFEALNDCTAYSVQCDNDGYTLVVCMF